MFVFLYKLCSMLSLATVYFMLYVITVQNLAAFAAQLRLLISKYYNKLALRHTTTHFGVSQSFLRAQGRQPITNHGVFTRQRASQHGCCCKCPRIGFVFEVKRLKKLYIYIYTYQEQRVCYSRYVCCQKL